MYKRAPTPTPTIKKTTAFKITPVALSVYLLSQEQDGGGDKKRNQKMSEGKAIPIWGSLMGGKASSDEEFVPISIFGKADASAGRPLSIWGAPAEEEVGNTQSRMWNYFH